MTTDQFDHHLKSKEYLPNPNDIQASGQPTLTFGARLVGIEFNPSGNLGVNEAKKHCSILADLVYSVYHNKSEHTELETMLFNQTIGEILNAQMNVVKLLTLKY